MNILNILYNSFTTRELASITLVVAFALYIVRFREIRNSIWQTIKACFIKPIIINVSILFSIVVVVCYGIDKCGYWKTEYLKDVIVYSFAAIPLLWKILKYSTRYAFADLIFENIKYAAIISIYLNMYCCSYIVELLWQSSLTISSLLLTTLETNKEQNTSAYSFISRVSAFLGYIALGYVIYRSFAMPLSYTAETLLVSIGLPLVLTAFIAPYLYIYSVCAAYESWFVIITLRTSNKIERLKRKLKLIMVCKCSLDKITYIRNRIRLYMYDENYESFARCVNASNLCYTFLRR